MTGDDHPFGLVDVDTVSRGKAIGRFVPERTRARGKAMHIAHREGERFAGDAPLEGEGGKHGRHPAEECAAIGWPKASVARRAATIDGRVVRRALGALMRAVRRRHAVRCTQKLVFTPSDRGAAVWNGAAPPIRPHHSWRNGGRINSQLTVATLIEAIATLRCVRRFDSYLRSVPPSSLTNAGVIAKPASATSISTACAVRQPRAAGSLRASHRFPAPVSVLTPNRTPIVVASGACELRAHDGAPKRPLSIYCCPAAYCAAKSGSIAHEVI